MSYGIEILNVNGNYIWTTEDQEHLEVVDSGTVANNSSVTYTKANEFLALNRPTTGYLTGTYNDTTFTNLSGTTINWIKVRRTTEQSTASSSQYSGDYGLESYDSSGNITFSSGFAKGLKLLQVHTPLSLTGGTDPLGGSSGDSIYSGDPTGVYYTPSLMDWDPYTGGNDGSQALDCANFSYSGTTGIKLIAYLSRYDRFGNNTTNTFDNRGFMLVFKRNG